MGAGEAVRKLIGGLLIVSGALIALCCGLCTGYFGIISVVNLFGSRSSDFGVIGPFMVIGVFATAIGIGLLFLGLRMSRT